MEKEKTYNVEELKKKYGKLYQVSSVFSDDDDADEEITVTFLFQKPKTATLNRYLKTASKNMTAATAAFLMDNIVPEQKEELQKRMEEYPALGLGIGQKLLSVLGLSDNVNLTKL